VLGDDDFLHLIDAETGGEVWAQDRKLGQAAFQGKDAERIYYNTVVGLTAVSLDTGEDVWSFSPQVGAAFRTAYVSETGVIVVAASDGLTGLDPATGAVLWTIASLTQGAWYWAPDGVTDTSTLVLIDPSRSNLYRVDL
jgi:outer membrane protein assembly factor BamB